MEHWQFAASQKVRLDGRYTVPDDVLSQVSSAEECHKDLRLIDLSNLNFTPQACISLKKILISSNIQYLFIRSSVLGDDGWNSIQAALYGRLVQLRMYYLLLSPTGMRSLSQGLQHSSMLRILEISGCSNMEDGKAIQELAIGLTRNHTLHSLKLSDCYIQDERLEKIVTAVIHHPCLINLILPGNKPGPLTSRAMAKMLRFPESCLEYLNLESYHSRRGPKLDMEVICESLKNHNTCLKKLDVSDCRLDDRDLEFLCDALCSKSVALEDLLIDRNSLSNRGIEYMASCLSEMKSLRNLNMWGNCFDEESLMIFARALERNYIMLGVLNLLYQESNESEELIKYYTMLNKAGRRLMEYEDTPLGLWPLVLERAQKIEIDSKRIMAHDLIYSLLRIPALLNR